MSEFFRVRIITERAEDAAKRMLNNPTASEEFVEYRNRQVRIMSSVKSVFLDREDEFYTQMREAMVQGAIKAANRGEFLLYANRKLEIGTRQFALPPKIIGSPMAYLRRMLL